jgi:PAS domain S-box-containing protein
MYYKNKVSCVKKTGNKSESAPPKQQSDENLLKESIRNWQATFNGINDSIFLLDSEGTILQSNKSSDSFFGSKGKDLLGCRCFQVIHNLDCHYDNCPLLRSKTSKKRETLTLPIEDKWFLVTVDPILDQSNTITNYVHIVSDITMQKQYEESLLQSEERFRLVFEEGQLGMILLSGSDGKFLEVNNTFCNMLGYTLDEMKDLTFMDITHPDHLSEDVEMVMKMWQKQIPKYHTEKRYLKKNGTVMWGALTASPIFSKEGKPLYILAMIEDITEQKQMYEELLQSEDNYRDLVENSSDLLCTHDLDGNFLSINNAAVNITGYSKQEALKMNMRDILVPEYQKIFNAYLIRIKEVGHAKGIIVIKTKSGERRIWEFNNSLRTAGVDKPIVRGMVKDVTELKSAEAVLKKLNSALVKSNAEKDKFFSIIAHDLKSPFFGFLGLTQDIAKNADNISAQDLAQFGSTMYQSADNLFKLLQNLLEWAQLHSGTVQLELKNISLTDLIKENVRTMKVRLEQKSISIFNLVNNPVLAYADEKMINSVLLNLLSNAVKFTKRNGTIIIKPLPVENNMVGISIHDNGVGIPKYIIDKLFHVGEKTGRKGTDGELSTGLGLLLSKEFVDKNGGNIWAESKEGFGTTFYLTLKAQP